jgi:hypothetical protein
MATTPRVITVLSEALGMHPSTLDRYIRELRGADMLRTGKPGGGRAALHYSASELVLVMLSTASTGPGGAVQAAQELSALRPDLNISPSLWDVLEKWLQVSQRTLGEFLALMVEKYRERGAEAAFIDTFIHSQEELTVCLDPLVAWTSQLRDAEKDEGDTYRCYWKPSQERLAMADAAAGFSRGRRIQVSFSFKVLRTLGELCAEGSGDLETPPKSENAALAGAAFSDQPDALPTGSTNNPDSSVCA